MSFTPRSEFKQSCVAAGLPACRSVPRRRQAGTPAATRLTSWLLLSLTFTLTLFAQETSELAPLAAHSLLLDLAYTGDKLVAVGEHGDVLISTDSGLTWTQRIVPTRALLTGVSFPDSQHGWAVGHDGVILATADGGQTWTRQDDGKDLDTVFLDVLFRDATHGFAVGAYGKFLVTADGGQHWTAAKPSEDEVHYNRINGDRDGILYLAGESGTLLLSKDQGKTWSKSNVPYDGSLFGALPLNKFHVLTYGLRGHILRSDDLGGAWEPLNNAVHVLIMAGVRLKDGTVVLAGQGGNFFVSRDASHTFTPWKPTDFSTSVADLVETDAGWIVTVGEGGAMRFKLP